MRNPNATRLTPFVSTAIVLAVLATALPATAGAKEAAAPGAAGAGDAYTPRQGNGGYDVRHYNLSVRYDPRSNRLTTGTRAVITARATQTLSRFNVDLRGLTVDTVTVDGTPAAAVARTGNELIITPASAIRVGATFRVVVRYRGAPGHQNSPRLGRNGWFNTDDGAIVVGQPVSASYWFPVNEHPSDKATYSVAVTVPDGVRAIGNGVEGPVRAAPRGWRTFTWSMRHPAASYLVTVAIGRWRVHRWTLGDGTPVLTAVDRSLPRYIDRELRRTGAVLAWLRRRLGPYPFEAAGAIVDNLRLGFALETQTRPVYSTAFFRRGTDGSYVIAHELSHQWLGDAVSLRRWRDIWLNEGFATWLETAWDARVQGRNVGDIFHRWYRRYGAGTRFWRLRVSDPGIGNLFSWPVYLRGAMTLQALRERIGAPAFATLLRTWYRRNDDAWGTTRQFQRLTKRLAPPGTRDGLGRFFRRWLDLRRRPAWPSADTSVRQVEPPQPVEVRRHAR